MACDVVKARLGIVRPVVLAVSQEARVPFVTGWYPAVIVLPAGYGGWKSERLRVVLAHELTHIRRADLVWQCAARLCEALAWFHPLVWLASWRLRVEREHACDDAVLLTMGERPSDYATHLVEIAIQLGNSSWRLASALAMAGRGQIKNRVRSILDPAACRSPAGRLRSCVSAMSLVVGLTVASAFAASFGQPPPAAQTLQEPTLAKRENSDSPPGKEVPANGLKSIRPRIDFRGRVVTGDPAKPVPNATLNLKPLTGNAEAADIVTDADERFATSRVATPAVVYVHNDDESLVGTTTLDGIATDSVDLKIAPSLDITAQLVDARRRPLANQTIWYGITAEVKVPGNSSRTDNVQSSVGTTDEDGNLKLKKIISGGYYTIRAAGTGVKLVVDKPQSGNVLQIVLRSSTERSSPGMDSQNSADGSKSLSLKETIDDMNARGKTAEAAYLTDRMEYAEKRRDADEWSFIFGRVVALAPDNPRYCDAQMAIHDSGWFLGSVGDRDKPIGFRMYGYHPQEVVHGGGAGTIVNVGDVILKRFRFNELAAVRVEVLFEGEVDPTKTSVKFVMGHPKTNSASGGTNGFYEHLKREAAVLGQDFKIQKTGLTPVTHYISIRAPGHLPFRLDFELKPGETTDIGVLKIPASPKFDLEFAIADRPDFTMAKRHVQTTYAGDPIRTNAAGKDWVEAGEMRVEERKSDFFLRCGLGGLVLTDLGEGDFDDFLTPVHPEIRKRYSRRRPVKHGHVYLISHTSQSWKHWTLMRVEMSISVPVIEPPVSDGPANDVGVSDVTESDAGVAVDAGP